jgi:hypothetical protein
MVLAQIGQLHVCQNWTSTQNTDCPNKVAVRDEDDNKNKLMIFKPLCRTGIE